MYFDHHQICVLVCSEVELEIDPSGSQKNVYSRAGGQCSLSVYRLKSFGNYSIHSLRLVRPRTTPYWT